VNARALVVAVVAVVLPACAAGPLDAVTVDPENLTSSLVAHWRFDESGGTIVGDSSGNGHDGTLTGGVWVSGGRYGGALELAPGNFVTVPNFPHATPNWTVSVWTKASPSQLVADAADETTIISTEVVLQGGWQLHLDNRAGFERYDAAYWVGPEISDYVEVDCHCIEPDVWVNLVAVFDTDVRALSLYRNGSRVSRIAMPQPILPGDPTLYIGRWNMNGRFIAAVLDDFAIWSRALTPGEIAGLSRASF
jgi:hypothetical protein